MEKKEADNCKHWLFPSCPQIHHPLMQRFRSGSSGGSGLDDDIDEMDRPCGACSAFSARIKLPEPVKKPSHLLFAHRHTEHGSK